MTREAISHVYQSTCYLCCGGPVAEEASQQANFSCSLQGCLRMLNTNSTCIFKYYTHREGIYSLLLQWNNDTSISMQVQTEIIFYHVYIYFSCIYHSYQGVISKYLYLITIRITLLQYELVCGMLCDDFYAFNAFIVVCTI